MVKFLLIVFLVSIILRRLVPFLVRLLLGRFVRQQQARAGGATFGSGGGEPAGRRRGPVAHGPDGDVRVAYAPPPKTRQPRPEGYPGGDYVEFEEVKPGARA